MRICIFGVVIIFTIVFSGLMSAKGDTPEVHDGLTIAQLGASETVRLDIDNPVISWPVVLSPDFQQGENNRWLIFRIHFKISYPLAANTPTDVMSDIQHVLSASIGDSTAVQIIATREDDQLSVNGIGWAEGPVTKFSTSDTIEMTYSNYFPEYLFPEDDTELRLMFEVSDRAKEVYAEIFPDSGFIETSQSPNSLLLDVLDIDIRNNNGDIFAVIHYYIVNEQSRNTEVKLAFFGESGEQILLDESQEYTLIGYQSVRGEAVVPITHLSQDFRGDLVAISDNFNSPSVSIELSKELGHSYSVHVLGLVIGAILLVFGSFFVVRLTNKYTHTRREKSEYTEYSN